MKSYVIVIGNKKHNSRNKKKNNNSYNPGFHNLKLIIHYIRSQNQADIMMFFLTNYKFYIITS